MTKLIKTLVYTAVDFESNLLLHIYILFLNLFSFFLSKKKNHLKITYHETIAASKYFSIILNFASVWISIPSLFI